MNSISFKNFRKYSDFPTLPLGKLNLFVGQNNSGKSTAIKAILLALVNASRVFNYNCYGGGFYLPLESFSFVNTLDAHIHLGDYANNLHNQSLSTAMCFSLDTEDYRGSNSFPLHNVRVVISFELNGSNLEKGGALLSVPLSRVAYDFPKYFASIDFNSIDSGDFAKFSFSLRGIHILMEDLRTEYNYAFAGSRDFDSDDDVMALKALLRDLQDRYLQESLTVPWREYDDMGTIVFEDSQIGAFGLSEQGKDGLRYAIRCLRFKAEDIFQHLRVEFIEAHSASHSELLYEEDKNNYLAQTVAKYESAHIGFTSDARRFVLKWLRLFNIGEDFKVIRPFSEVLRVEIKTKTGWRSLGAMGTGSIQVFILLLRVAIAIDNKKSVALFVEEPEQNLHPALQSLLTDMFIDAIEISKHLLQFVVETHSEYMVRRTQVSVASMIRDSEKDIDSITELIKVYYFPENDAPYSMEFRSTGQFEHNFGQGFFDEAGKNYRALLERSL